MNRGKNAEPGCTYGSGITRIWKTGAVFTRIYTVNTIHVYLQQPTSHVALLIITYNSRPLCRSTLDELIRSSALRFQTPPHTLFQVSCTAVEPEDRVTVQLIVLLHRRSEARLNCAAVLSRKCLDGACLLNNLSGPSRCDSLSERGSVDDDTEVVRSRVNMRATPGNCETVNVSANRERVREECRSIFFADKTRFPYLCEGGEERGVGSVL